MPFLFFASYARANSQHPSDAALLEQFIRDLEAEVRQLRGETSAEDLCFFDRADIEAGSIWTAELEEALRTSRVVVPLYSPNYFASDWCGKELQVFLERSKLEAGCRPVVPALWIVGGAVPKSVSEVQYDDGTYPREYSQVGLRKLMQVGRYKDAYVQSIAALAASIAAALAAPALPELPLLSLSDAVSAWSGALAARSHASGSISKTCFVFVAADGRNWRPYPQTKRIGSIAQQLSGELDLDCVEIPCDEKLVAKLRDTHKNNVPTVLFGHPASLTSEPFLELMNEYDTLYLLNCGTLLAWDSSDTLDERLADLQKKVFKQKIAKPPPNHEWRSIFSEQDLWQRTRETIEQIRLRLLGDILANGSGVPVLKAHSPELSEEAARTGLSLDVAPQVVAVAPQPS